MPPPILTMFYKGNMKSILNGCITVCCLTECKTLFQIVRIAKKIKLHGLFTLLPSGRRYHGIQTNKVITVVSDTDIHDGLGPLQSNTVWYLNKHNTNTHIHHVLDCYDFISLIYVAISTSFHMLCTDLSDVLI